MALAVWPAGLPQCIQKSGFSQTLANNLTVDQFDIGPPQVRQRSTAAPEMVNGSIILDESKGELTLFRTFYNSTLLSGSQRFTWVDPVTQVSVQMLFKPDAQPSFSNMGGTFYSATLQLMQFTV